MGRLILALVVASLLLGACGGGVSGEVAIETVGTGDGGYFDASGGVVCDLGTFENLTFEITDTSWTFEDRYTCADGSGSFVMSAVLSLDPELAQVEPTEGSWTVGNGTGDYGDLTGSGTLVSTLFFEGKEKYTGKMERS